MGLKTKNILLAVLMAGALLAGFLCGLLLPDREFSQSERRKLATMPELSAENLLSGAFAEDFETYVQDQFPLREGFRGLKALTETYALGKLDNNGLYLAEGHLSKLDYPLNEKMLDHAAERFRYLYDTYLAGKDMNIYLAVIPDKNVFLAGPSGRLSYDYEALVSAVREKADYMEYIDLFSVLSLADYYRTDSHWRQERLLPVAERLAGAMGAELPQAEYQENSLNTPFYGVYSGQSALPVSPDTLVYLTCDAMDGCTVTGYGSGKAEALPMYDMDKGQGRDPYELFLSGSQPVITIENPKAETGRELIIFRDSYASSLAPLLVGAYSRITLVDIRYVQSAALDRFVDFGAQDVLFLYSSTLLNNSLSLR